MGAAQLDLPVADLYHRFPRLIGFNVSEVADVTFSGVRAAVRLGVRVEVGSGGHRIRSRAIAEFVDMEGVHPRRQSHNLPADLNLLPLLDKPARSVRLAPFGRVQNADGLSA